MAGLLPSLAALTLHTDAPKRKYVYDAEEGAKGARGAAPPLRLNGLPRDVLSVMVSQAAKAAREGDDPAHDMCAWMEHFCTSAKVEGVECYDDWYRLALDAFAYDLQADMPKNTGFPKWQPLFYAVCNAHNRSLASTATLWAKFWRDYFGSVGSVAGLVGFQGANLRDRDVMLQAMVSVVGADAQGAAGGALDYRGRIMEAEQNEQLWQQWLRVGGVPRFEEGSDEMALVVLLLMQGAKAYREDYWDDLDMTTYAAILDGMEGLLAWDDVIPRVRELLRQGADPAFDGGTMITTDRTSPTPLARRGRGWWPNLLCLCILTNNSELLDLVVGQGEWWLGDRALAGARLLFKVVSGVGGPPRVERIRLVDMLSDDVVDMVSHEIPAILTMARTTDWTINRDTLIKLVQVISHKINPRNQENSITRGELGAIHNLLRDWKRDYGATAHQWVGPILDDLVRVVDGDIEVIDDMD